MEKDYLKEFKTLWVTNALNGSEDYLVSERIYGLVGMKLVYFQKQLMETQSPRNLVQTLFDYEGEELVPAEDEEELFDYKDTNPAESIEPGI